MLKSALFLLISVFGLSAWATKMDIDTHTAVITRLQQVVQSLDDGDSSKAPAALRLADLLAERSRLKGLKEVELNCTNCLKAKEDRLEAVKYYSYVIPLLPDDTRSQAMLQKAHLHYALGDAQKTEALYKQIVNEGRRRHSSLVMGQAYASLGDVLFQKTKFTEARASYEKALAIPETPQKGMIYYRLAWCLFNLDQVQRSVAMLEMILTTPRLTQLANSEGAGQDTSFKIDVSKDLATFYSRTTINRSRINRLLELSPAENRQDNLFFLATETDRLGKKREAAMVWMVYLENSPKDKTALEAQIRLMKIKRDLGDLKGSLAVFAHVGQLWKNPGCGDRCPDLQAQIRKFVTDWNREEKKFMTPELTQAYVMYCTVFPNDAEMYFWGAEVAKQRKQFRQSVALYHHAALVAHKQLERPKDMNAEQIKGLKSIFEGSLIGEIDMAETMKDHELRMNAYKNYLALNPNGAREFEVRYQMAQSEFERQQYDNSASAFRKLAIEKNARDKALQKTAASMSIESLIRLKRADLIETWSYEYAGIFTKDRKEFLMIHRKTVLNSVAVRINQKTATKTDQIKLGTVSLEGGTHEDRISLYNSQYLLAIQLQDFGAAKKAVTNLLAVKELSNMHRNEAVRNRIWLAELELDFRTAYYMLEAQDNKLTADRALRLIWLSQMAGLPSEKHENQFLSLSGNRAARAAVITNHVQRQRNPSRALKPYLKELSQSPEVLARLSLEIYARNKSRSTLEDAYEFRSVRNTPTGTIIGRLLQYPELKKQIARLGGARLNARTQNALKSSLESRIKMMADLEQVGQKAISNKDPVLQSIVLATLMRENDRLHNDIIALPAPRGLTQQQKEQYDGLVAQQAAPYKSKAIAIAEKLNQLWADDSWSERLAQNYIDARNEYKPALLQDLEMLSNYAPSSARPDLILAMSKPQQLPSRQDLASAQQQVRKYPFSEDYVKELRDVENRRGNDVVVAHLDARLSQMKGTTK